MRLQLENMRKNPFQERETHDVIEVTLDGLPVPLPSGCGSLNAIRCHLETLALESRRILYSLSVDGNPVHLALPLPRPGAFCRVEAGTIALEETSLRVLKQAYQQTEHARECVETALTLVLINNGRVACEVWWNLAAILKEPVLTLSLLPDHVWGAPEGPASLTRLRKWQLEQIAAIIRDVNAACHEENTIPLSDALENRVLPWLQKLGELICLWHETALAGSRLGITGAVA